MLKNDKTKVVTGVVRLSYANVWEPKAINGVEKYSVSIIINKDDYNTLGKIDIGVDAAIEEGIKKFPGAMTDKSALKLPLRDGDDKFPYRLRQVQAQQRGAEIGRQSVEDSPAAGVPRQQAAVQRRLPNCDENFHKDEGQEGPAGDAVLHGAVSHRQGQRPLSEEIDG